MTINKKYILDNICYTQLVYRRINKKLNTNYSKQEIEDLIHKLLKETDEEHFSKIGKNYYVKNKKNYVSITINSNTYTVITVDKIKA